MRRFTIYPKNKVYGGPVNFDDLNQLDNEMKAKDAAKKAQEDAVITALESAKPELISFAIPFFEDLEKSVNSDVQQILSNYGIDEQAFINQLSFNWFETYSGAIGLNYVCEPDRSNHEGPCWFLLSMDDEFRSSDYEDFMDKMHETYGKYTPMGNFNVDKESNTSKIEFFAPDGDILVESVCFDLTNSPLIYEVNPDTVVSDVKKVLTGFRDFIDNICSDSISRAAKECMYNR